jgi:opacity protein-like surface antigen
MMPSLSEPACLRRAVVRALTVLPLLLPAAVAAQGPGFLFKQPFATLTFRAGYSVPSVSSDVFEDTREFLTVDRSDFNAFSFGGDLGIRAANRIDIALGFAYARSSTRSEFRDWVDEGNLPGEEDDRPIEQETRLTRLPLTATVKAYLLDRGRNIGRFAWVPSAWAPYAGVGGGAMWYRYHQGGEFVDFENLDIFPDVFESSGWTPTAHVLAGADFSLTPRLALNAEGRYGWAKADMGPDFVGFDKIDLAGFQATLGLSVRF